ncbi:MAG TPA: hypothetical protein VLD63_04510, partial [Anaerolineales bacterium]|nr:hypothetical protein [Anaerolineales bacterium]
MHRRTVLMVCVSILIAASIACGTVTTPQPSGAPTLTPREPVPATGVGPDEPVSVSGRIPFTSPFFLQGNAEPFVLLEDESGFVARNREFVFPLEGQAIGPVEKVDDQTLRYTLPLPSAP